MAQAIWQKTTVARKDYECNACLFMIDCIPDLKGLLSFGEWRSIAKAKANGWKIKKGEPYLSYTVVEDGEMYRVRCIPSINEICIDHQLYTD